MTDRDVERATMRRVSARLLPFIFLLYIFCGLDRSNVSIAALEMNEDLKFSSAAFGLGAGIFFLGYALLEIPSNLLLARVGARRWLARIAITWGIVACAMMFIRTPVQFYAMRFLLGVAEAGFFPGVIYYLGLWFPATYRARAISGILIGIPLSQVVGAPLGGALLGMTGVAHLAGWQWIFLVEGLPPIFLGFIALGYLTNRPEEARWLSTQQRDWLSNCLEHEGQQAIAAQVSPLRALRHPLLWILIVPYFSLCAIGYGAALWTPLLVRDALGTGNTATSQIVGGIFLLSALVYPLAGMLSDRWDDRCGWAALGLMFYCVGGMGVALLPHTILRLVALMIMHVGNPLFHCSFWCVPTKFLKGPSAAAGIALISSIGISGGFFGPSIVGFLKDKTGSDSGAFLGLAVLALFGAIVCIGLRQAAFAPGGRSAIRVASTNSRST